MRIDVILAVLMLIALFLPWVSLGVAGVSGFDIIRATFEAESQAGFGSAADAPEGWLVYVLYAIPVAALLTLIIGLARGPSNIFAIIAGAAPWVLVIYGATQAGDGFGQIFDVLGVGAYATLVVGLLLFLSGLGVMGRRR